MALTESLYKLVKNRKNLILNKGFAYQDKLFERSMSPLLFNEAKREGILKKMEKVMVELIERVKKIKTFVNFAVDKDYRDFN